MPAWRHILERLSFLWRAGQAARAIHASGMFDARWYVAGGGGSRWVPPLLHYVMYGAAQGISPCAGFDGDWYLRRYPEIGMSGFNPLAHYVTQGRRGGYDARVAVPGLPRQAMTPSAYAVWTTEMNRLLIPLLEQEAAAATPPRIGIAGQGYTGSQDTPFLLLLPHGVGMVDHAPMALALALQADPAADLLFADEDRLDTAGQPQTPWFKPGFDPELMQAGDLTGPAAVLRRDLLERLGWDGAAPDADGLRRLCLAAWRNGARIAHVPAVLFHRPAAPHLAPVQRQVPALRPTVSVIMPTRDRATLLRRAAEGVLNQTAYGPVELLIVDNGSRARATLALLDRLAADPRVRVLRVPGPFNWSSLNNRAALAARGEVLVLLNNDIEVVAPDWLSALVAQAMRPEIGVAGARLLYPDRTIQHAGLTLDPAGCWCHAMRGAPAEAPGAVGERLVAHSVAAVTGACLAIRRDVFEAVGGLEERVLGVTSNDVDLCLRVRDAGYRVVYEPASVLLHHEAASRGHDTSPAQAARVLAERDYLRRVWDGMARFDPYQNPNLCLLAGQPALEAPARVLENPRFGAVFRRVERAQARALEGLLF